MKKLIAHVHNAHMSPVERGGEVFPPRSEVAVTVTAEALEDIAASDHLEVLGEPEETEVHDEETEGPAEPTVKELKARAKELGIEGTSNLRKDDLAELIAQAEDELVGEGEGEGEGETPEETPEITPEA